MRVPFFRPSFSKGDVQALAEVLDSGHLTAGPRCVEFEAAFAECLGVRHAVSTNSGTAALQLALAAIHIQPGEIVFVPTMAFASDVEAVESLGGTPILVDCEARTLCMDVEKLRQTIAVLLSDNSIASRGLFRGRLRAVLVVDYAGQMADYGALREVCRDHDLLLIEDAAHALPAGWRSGPGGQWQSPGNVADLACFSFYANKPITTGEGGMVVTNDDRWAADMRTMRYHGFEPMCSEPREANWKRQVVSRGFKNNLSDLEAALGLRQLSRVHESARARQAIADGYTARLNSCPFIELPQEQPDRRHAWHIYAIRLTGPGRAGHRDAIMEALYHQGIETSVHWYPLHLHKYHQHRLRRVLDFPVAEDVYPRLISLPVFPAMTEEQVEAVSEALLALDLASS